MTLKVVDFTNTKPADDPDVVLEEAKGVYKKVLVIGYTKDGMLDGRCNHNMSIAEAHMLCAQMKAFLLESTMPDYVTDYED